MQIITSNHLKIPLCDAACQNLSLKYDLSKNTTDTKIKELNEKINNLKQTVWAHIKTTGTNLFITEHHWAPIEWVQHFFLKILGWKKVTSIVELKSDSAATPHVKEPTSDTAKIATEKSPLSPKKETNFSSTADFDPKLFKETMDKILQWRDPNSTMTPEEKAKAKKEEKGLRISVFNGTKRAIMDGSCRAGNETVQLRTSKERTALALQTRIMKIPVCPPVRQLHKNMKISVENSDALLVAQRMHKETPGARIAVLNLANATVPGGGVESGSGAQEESIFRVTDYAAYLSLENATLRESMGGRYSIPEDGVVYTPGVRIFRHPQALGFAFRKQEEIFDVDMIACAGYCLNPFDPAYDESKIPNTPKARLEGVEKKCRAILYSAIETNVTHLVLGALGCGAFESDDKENRKHFLNSMKKLLTSNEFNGAFEEVSFAILSFGTDTLFDNFKETFAETK